MKRHISSLRRTQFLVFYVVVGAVLYGIASVQETQETQLAAVINSPSSVGDVAFPHQLHFKDLELECQACHHETNASALRMPHEAYFEDFWIDCGICHKSDGSAVSQPQSCSNCHHDSPTGIADETLSAKVVIHKQCWQCHELEKGAKASQSCSDCHLKNPGKVNRL